jgi:flagellar biosynthesis chaperone FliJ
MEDARHKRHTSALNRRRMVTRRRQSRTDTRGLQSIRRKLRERKIHRAKLEKLAERKAVMMRRRQQRRSHQG